MMKRWTAMLCALALLFAALPALAQDDAAAVLALYDHRAEGDVYLGTAVCCGGRLLTVAGTAVTGAQALYLTDGQRVMEIDAFRGAQSGLAFITPRGAEAGEGLPLAEALAGQPVTLLSSDGKRAVTTDASPLAPVTWQAQPCYLTEAAAPVPLGAAAVNEAGCVVGLIAACWGEGIDRYVVLPLAAAVQAPAGEDQLSRAASAQDVAGYTVTAEGQRLTVDWSSCQLPKKAQNGVVSVYVMDMDNPYYMWETAEATSGSLSFPGVPGRTYALWVRCAAQAPETPELPNGAYQTVTMPESVAFVGHGYREEEMYLGLLPAGLASGAELLKAEEVPVTLDLLEEGDKDPYFQAVSTYQVEEDVTCEMLLVLTTPEGYAYLTEGSFIFMTDLADGDMWNCSLRPLFDAYAEHAGGLCPGAYTISYYFDGALVNTMTYDLR